MWRRSPGLFSGHDSAEVTAPRRFLTRCLTGWRTRSASPSRMSSCRWSTFRRDGAATGRSRRERRRARLLVRAAPEVAARRAPPRRSHGARPRPDLVPVRDGRDGQAHPPRGDAAAHARTDHVGDRLGPTSRSRSGAASTVSASVLVRRSATAPRATRARARSTCSGCPLTTRQTCPPAVRPFRLQLVRPFAPQKCSRQAV